MAEIGAYEAKTHLPKLLERVDKGERFVITRHGRPVAELVPVSKPDARQVRRAVSRLRGDAENVRQTGAKAARSAEL